MTAPRVLVVDDDPVMRELMGEQLAVWGCESALAGGVDEAVDALARRAFDLVLSDLHMPPKNGFELLAQVRARWPATQLIMLSSFPARETAKQAIDAGALSFLAKPFSLRALKAALEAGGIITPA